MKKLLSEIAYLIEMPKLISSLDWHDLNSVHKNKEWYQKYHNQKFKHTLFSLSKNVIMYQLGGHYFVLDHNQHKIIYFVSTKHSNNGKIGSYTNQSLVWSDSSHPNSEGLSKQVFFDILLPKYKTLICDSEQTWDGKRFWGHRIIDAFKSGLTVGYYDFSKHENIIFQNIKEFTKFNDSHDVWGDTKQHELKRYYIKLK